MYRKLSYQESRFLVSYLGKHIEDGQKEALVFDLKGNKFKYVNVEDLGDDTLSTVLDAKTLEAFKQQVLKNSSKKTASLKLLTLVNTNADMQTYFIRNLENLNNYLGVKLETTPVLIHAVIKGTKRYFDYYVATKEHLTEVINALAGIEDVKGKDLEFFVNEVK